MTQTINPAGEALELAASCAEVLDRSALMIDTLDRCGPSIATHDDLADWRAAARQAWGVVEQETQEHADDAAGLLARIEGVPGADYDELRIAMLKLWTQMDIAQDAAGAAHVRFQVAIGREIARRRK